MNLSLRSTALPSLIASSHRLSVRAAGIRSLISSAYGNLFERQNLGLPSARTEIGPPGRPEGSADAPARSSVINLSGSSYLGLGADSRVRQAAAAALERHGSHSAGTRVLSGTTQLHHLLESALARFWSVPSVATCSSGYVTNLSTIAALFGAGDLVILDRGAHRSLYDGALLSGAKRRRFRHNDLNDLERILGETSDFSRRLVVAESVYSMDGTIAPVDELSILARRHGAFLLVDEAHAVGVLGATGRGSIEHFRLEPGAIDLRIGTMSKSLAAIGGFVAAHPEVVRLLRYTSHGAVFSAALSPPDVAAAMTALYLLEREPERVTKLRKVAAWFRGELVERGLDTMGSESPIVPIRIGDRTRTLAAASALLIRGVYVSPIISPGVPTGTERLRCVVSYHHAAADLAFAADAIAEVVASV